MAQIAMNIVPNRRKMTIYDPSGARKYLTKDERDQFLDAAASLDRLTRTFCMTLAYTGCRLSEATALTGESIDFSAKAVVIETLKKRHRGIFRSVPVPPNYLEAIELVHGLRELKHRKARLWPWSRRTAGRRVEEVMALAKLEGIHATAKGLRHGFAIFAIQKGVGLNTVQKWLGHANMETTAIYTEAVGDEERALAMRMWD